MVSRSGRLLAGLSTDLVIDQALMRSLKTSGGLTRGRGFTEQQRLIWLLCMPACAETNRRIPTRLSKTRTCPTPDKGSMKDTLVILTNFADRDPSSADPNLPNTITDVNARALGEKILSSINDREISDRLHVQA